MTNSPLAEFSIEVTLLGAPESIGKISTPGYATEIRRLADRVTITFERREFVPERDFSVEVERHHDALDTQPRLLSGRGHRW